MQGTSSFSGTVGPSLGHVKTKLWSNLMFASMQLDGASLVNVVAAFNAPKPGARIWGQDRGRQVRGRFDRPRAILLALTWNAISTKGERKRTHFLNVNSLHITFDLGESAPPSVLHLQDLLLLSVLLSSSI